MTTKYYQTETIDVTKELERKEKPETKEETKLETKMETETDAKCKEMLERLDRLKQRHDKKDRFRFDEILSETDYAVYPKRIVVRVTKKNNNKSYIMKITGSYDEFSFDQQAASPNRMYTQELNEHNNFVHVYKTKKDNPYVVTIMDYHPKQCLQKISRKIRSEKKIFDEKTILNWMIDMANGLYHLHNFVKSKNEATDPIFIEHGNIKPSNCLITENDELILTDVVSAGVNRLEAKLNAAEYINYLPPEVFNEDYEREEKTRGKIDMWGFGATFYEMMTHHFPNFFGITVNKRIEDCKLDEKYSIEIIDFVKKLLDIEPDTRININEALKQLIEIKKCFGNKYPEYHFRKIIGEEK